MNENEKDIQETIDKFTAELYDSLGIPPEYFSDTSPTQIQHNYQQYQLCQILRPYERQIDVLNAQLLVATTLLKQIAGDMETVGDRKFYPYESKSTVFFQIGRKNECGLRFECMYQR